MSSRHRVLLSLLAAVATPAAAEPDWIIASQSEQLPADGRVELQVIRPSDKHAWPAQLRLRLVAADGKESEVALQASDSPAPEALRRTYSGELERGAPGVLRVELSGLPSNRLALLVGEAEFKLEPMPATQPVTLAAGPEADGGQAEARTVTLDETELPALSVNEPMYFLFGKHGDARFQLSFNYRLFAPQGPVVKLLPILKGLHFGYTQNSFWDLGADSKPFHDTSYRPSLFWQGRLQDAGWYPQFWKAGYEHESNGRDDEDSRSIDTLFFEPEWRREFADGNALSFAPRFRVYLNKDENPDIHQYRGYANWALGYGRDDGWKFSVSYRQGTAGYASGQIDASYPLGTEVFSNIGSFVHFQYFSGYGETLLDYDRKSSDQFRIGISIVR